MVVLLKRQFKGIGGNGEYKGGGRVFWRWGGLRPLPPLLIAKVIFSTFGKMEQLCGKMEQFGNEVEKMYILVFSQTVEHIMLQTSGTINVPERLAYKTLHLALLAHLLLPNNVMFHMLFLFLLFLLSIPLPGHDYQTFR